MEQSAIVGFSASLTPQDVHDFRDAPFCSLEVFARMVEVSPDVVRGWAENNTIPTAKVGRRRVVNLHRFRNDLSTQAKPCFAKATTRHKDTAMTIYTYEIHPRQHAAGYRLFLLEDGTDVGGKIFPPGDDNYSAAAAEGLNWVRSHPASGENGKLSSGLKVQCLGMGKI